jgi:protein TonB
MHEKKHPKLRLENYSKIFTQLGLVLALFIVYVVMEHKTFEKTYEDLGEAVMTADLEEIPPITMVAQPELPKPKPILPKEILIVDNSEDIKEDIFETTETEEDEGIFDIDAVEEVTDYEPIVEDVPFHIIEDAPIFPGCKGDQEALKACFNRKMQQHFGKKFDADLPNKLGLSAGKKRLIMLFKIDKTGDIVDVRVRAPHPKLEKEAKRIVSLLPRMKPGMQRGKPVGVKYTLPMRIDVE